jgi:hypothetical protein
MGTSFDAKRAVNMFFKKTFLEENNPNAAMDVLFLINLILLEFAIAIICIL